YDLGLGNIIAGAIGGVVGGQILQHLIPALAGLDVSSLVSQLIAAGAGGAILTVMAGAVKNMGVGKSIMKPHFHQIVQRNPQTQRDTGGLPSRQTSLRLFPKL